MNSKNFYHSTSVYKETQRHLTVTQHEDSTVSVEHRHVPPADTEGDPDAHDPSSQPIAVDAVFDDPHRAIIFGNEVAKQAMLATRVDRPEDWREAWIHDWVEEVHDKLIQTAQNVLRTLPAAGSDRSVTSICDSVNSEMTNLAGNLPRLSTETIISGQQAYNERTGEPEDSAN